MTSKIASGSSKDPCKSRNLFQPLETYSLSHDKSLFDLIMQDAEFCKLWWLHYRRAMPIRSPDLKNLPSCNRPEWLQVWRLWFIIIDELSKRCLCLWFPSGHNATAYAQWALLSWNFQLGSSWDRPKESPKFIVEGICWVPLREKVEMSVSAFKFQFKTH